ncbi:hypothetical protein QBC33DRAFT_560609 [Phialemonium atrogriseum]|uniref:Uncharacterized protein n=1 Tax=Phialemonium atrogriseum TaxID=1093897 RepID=A0AAJ0FKL2_9PEZI|nr:uncharacterized protein QBC33DRAFT_560609 [Phialemonium atrogriseum]KAK1765689.1 hypothetical protein QBC33DRAFT_560609 [Phialemonium atrogriseum]
MAPGVEASAPFDLHSSDSTKTNDTSYFPNSPQSLASSTSSLAVSDFSLRPPQPSRATTTSSTTSTSSQSRITPIDALSRQYPAPIREVSVEEMLARPPQKWSLGHYVKNAREARTPVLDKEQQGKDFAEAKRELLAAKEQLKQLAAGGR